MKAPWAKEALRVEATLRAEMEAETVRLRETVEQRAQLVEQLAGAMAASAATKSLEATEARAIMGSAETKAFATLGTSQLGASLAALARAVAEALRSIAEMSKEQEATKARLERFESALEQLMARASHETGLDGARDFRAQ